jgi:hypothetical protein
MMLSVAVREAIPRPGTMQLYLLLGLLLATLAKVQSHGTEVLHCITPDNKLRIYVEHWHEDLTSPVEAGTMQIQDHGSVGEPVLTLFPTGHLNNITPEGLPGCRGGVAPTQDATCPGEINNDWVYYEFPAPDLCGGVSANYTFLSGDTVYLTEGCSTLYPVTITESSNSTSGDNDSDGICDDVDSCPNTPAGQAVDLNGCASTVGANGDPHFSTWKGEHYDYHGKCDLELVSDPLFANGKGLDVHIRTEIVRQWSFIKYAAIRIGNDILEVEGGADDNHYWFNKVYQGELTTLGGFPVKYKKANSKQHVYTIDLGNKEEIVIRTFKDFVRIDFKEPKKSLYGNTVGLLADFNTGKKLGRDGFTIIEDYNDFGQEWQVLSDGPKLFHEVSGRQFPGQKCILPSELHAEEKRRRGQEKRIGGGTSDTAVTDTIAELACAKVSFAEHDACVSDVLVTGDVDMAGAY